MTKLMGVYKICNKKGDTKRLLMLCPELHMQLLSYLQFLLLSLFGCNLCRTVMLIIQMHNNFCHLLHYKALRVIFHYNKVSSNINLPFGWAILNSYSKR